MNNVLAVRSRAATLTANTNGHSPYIGTTPPSPTAVAINLLNLLKIANTMSHPMYNPYASGQQSSSQGQYGLSSGQIERDPRMASSHFGPGPSFSSSGLSGGPLERDPRMASSHVGPGSSFSSSGFSSGLMERNLQMPSPYLGPGSSFNSSGLSSGPTERNPLMASSHLGPGSSFSSSGFSSGPKERNPMMAPPHFGPGSSFTSSGFPSGLAERDPRPTLPQLGTGSGFSSSGLSSEPTERNPMMLSSHFGTGSTFTSFGLSSELTERNPMMASPNLGPGSRFNSSGLYSGAAERDPRKVSPLLGPGSSFTSSGFSSGPAERDHLKASSHLVPGSSFNSSGLSSGPGEMDAQKASPHLGPGSTFSCSALSSGTTERDLRKSSPHLGPGSSFNSSGLSSTAAERDPRKASPHLGPGAKFSSSGTSSVTLGNTMGNIQSLVSLPTKSYRPEVGGAKDESIERSVDLHLSRAREEVRHQSANQGSRYTSTHRDEFPSTSTGTTSYLTPPASQGQSNVGSGSSSLDCLPICKANEDKSSSKYSSAPTDVLKNKDSRLNTSSEGHYKTQTIPGLGDYEDPVPDKSVPPTETARPKYTSESASNILIHFGLEKEDLEHLILYPEDQITPDNLPFILRQIRIQKTKRSSTAVQSVSYSTTQPTTTVSEMDRLSASRGAVLNQDNISSAILKPSQVIDYGHTGKYTAGVGDENERTFGSKPNSSGSGGAVPMDTFSGSSRQPLQRSTTEMKNSSFVSQHIQISTVTNISAMRSSVAPPASDPTKKLQPQPNQTSQSIFSTSSLPKKDTDMRQLQTNPEASKSHSLKLSEPDLQATPKTQPSCTLYRGVHPSRPGLVVIGRNDDGFNKNQSQAQASKVAEQVKQQQTQLQQRGNTLQPRTLTAVKPVPPPPVVPVPPALSQQTSSGKGCPPLKTLPPYSKESPANAGVPKHMPTPAMLQDYAAATPGTFPHTCLLCSKECTNMKDWLSHQNTSLHLENCKFLRTRYPDWDGEIRSLRSNSGKDVKPSTYCQTTQNRHQKSRHESPSRSRSPQRQRGSDDRRAKRSSRSRSRSPRYRSSLESRKEKRSSRSRSRSPHQYYSSESRREKRSRSPPYTSRHSCRSRSRSSSPRYDRPSSSRYQSRSESRERRSPPRRRDEKRSSPRRSHERRSPPRRNVDRRSTPVRSRERRSSGERSQLQRKKASSSERLAKRLLETPAVQSLSNPSDLEAVVKTLAPALLAELAKMKSASSTSAASSSSTSNAAKKDLSTKMVKAKPSLQKSGASSSAKSKLGKSSPPTMVKLRGVSSQLSHKDVQMAMEEFGKTKSVMLFRMFKEAVVCFEKVEHAAMLRGKKTFAIKGVTVDVVEEKGTVAKKSTVTSTKKPPQQKSTKSSDSTAQTTKSTSSGKVKAPLTLPSGAKKTTSVKLASKAKTLVSKAKTISTKQTVKTAKANSAPGKEGLKSVEVKKDAPKLSGTKMSKVQGKKSDASISKQNPKLKKPQGNSKEAVVMPKEARKVDKPSSSGASESIEGKQAAAVAKICTSTSKTASAPKPGKEVGSSAEAAAVTKENTTEAVVKTTNVFSDPALSENPPDSAKTFKAKIVEVKSKESAKVPEDTKACKKENEKPLETKQLEESANEGKVSEQLEPSETMAKPMEVEGLAEAKGQKLAGSKTSPSTPSDSHTETSTVSPPKPQVLSPQVQQASAIESKVQMIIEAKASPTKPCDPPTSTENSTSSRPCSHPPQSKPTTIKTPETLVKTSPQVQQSRVPHSESTKQKLETKTNTLQKQQQAGGGSAEAGVKTKQTGQGAEPEPKQKDLAAEVETQTASTAVKVSDMSPEPVKTKPTAASSAATAVPPKVKMEVQQQKISSCLKMETILPPSRPPSGPGNKNQQPTQEPTSPSAVSATSAASILSGTGTTQPTVNVTKAPEPETEIAAHTTVSLKTCEDVKKVKEERSPTKISVTSTEHMPSACNPTLPTATHPLVKSEENTDFSQLDVETLKMITVAVRQHRLAQGSEIKNEDKESTSSANKSSANAKDEDTPQIKAQDDTEAFVSFDDDNFNFEDFVTVDEIGEDVEDSAVDDSSSNNQIFGKKGEQPSSDVSSSPKKSSTWSSKNSASSSSSSTKSTKSSSISNPTSVSPKNKKDSSESTKSSVGKTSSYTSQLVQTPAPPSQKAQPSKTKLHTTSSAGRSTRTSAAAGKTSGETPQSHRVETKPKYAAVTSSGHKVAAESSAAKSVESETKIETSSEMAPPAQRRELELIHQTQSVKSDFKDDTVQKEDESRDKERKKDDKRIQEEVDDGERYHILDSFSDITDEQMNKEGNQDGDGETQTSGPEQSQTSHRQDHQVSEEGVRMQMGCSTVKDQPATAEEDKGEGSTELNISDGSGTQITDSSDKSAGDDTVRVNEALDKDVGQIPRKTEEGIPSEDSTRISEDAGQISDNQKQPPKDAEPEASVTLDSVSVQIVEVGDSLKPETSSDQLSKADAGSTEEDEDAYQVIDSLEDQPAEVELEADSKEKGTKMEDVDAPRVDKPSRRTSARTRASKSEEKASKKQDKTPKEETQTRVITGKDEDAEETVYEVVDSVEDESLHEIKTTKKSAKRRTTRGTTEDKTPTSTRIEVHEKADREEEAVFEVLDSVEDEAAADEPTIRRSTRARREKPKKDAEKEKPGKDVIQTRGRSTPARDSQEQKKEKSTEKEDKALPKEKSQAKKSDAVLRDTSEEEATYEILDAVEEEDEEAVEDVRRAVQKKTTKGRPKKTVKTAKKQSAAQKKKDSSSTGAEEEEEEAATFQILDSVEDETPEDQAPVDQSRSKRMPTTKAKSRKKPRTNSPVKQDQEEEPMYQIVDSLEDDQVQEELMTMEMSKEEEEKDENKTKDEAPGKKDTKTTEASKPELKEKIQDQLVDATKEADDKPSADSKDKIPKPDVKKEDKPATKSPRGAVTSDEKHKSPKKGPVVAAGSSLVNLDEVSDEEEDYPDDTAEEEELKKRQAAAAEREREVRRTRERDQTKRERRSQSRSSSAGRQVRKTRDKGQENEEKGKEDEAEVEEDSQELVTLDEVGEDEAAEGRGLDREITEGELQELVTLDEIVENEEEEEGKEEQPSQESQPVDFLKPESLASSDEPGRDEDKKTDEEEQEKFSRSTKRKCDDDTDMESFVTLDEVGKTEKEEEEEKPATRTKGRPKKRSRQTPVRNSPRRTTVSTEDVKKEDNELHPPTTLESFSSLDKDTSSSVDQLEIQKTEKEEASGHTDVQSASAGQQPESECPDNKSLGGSVQDEEKCNTADGKGTDKRRGAFVGPEAKRARSQSPCVPDVKLPPFSPNCPLGQEFVVPKSGFFCNLCSIFYLNESTAKEVHCSSQKHYDNLLKHYQNLEMKT